MKKLRKYGTAFAVAGSSALVMAAGSVHAAVPAEVTEALGAAKDDGSEIGWAVLAVLIAIAAFKYMRRAI